MGLDKVLVQLGQLFLNLHDLNVQGLHRRVIGRQHAQSICQTHFKGLQLADQLHLLCIGRTIPVDLLSLNKLPEAIRITDHLFGRFMERLGLQCGQMGLRQLTGRTAQAFQDHIASAGRLKRQPGMLVLIVHHLLEAFVQIFDAHALFGLQQLEYA